MAAAPTGVDLLARPLFTVTVTGMAKTGAHQPDVAATMSSIVAAIDRAGVDLAEALKTIGSRLDEHQTGRPPTRSVTDVAADTLKHAFDVDVTIEAPPNPSKIQDVIDALMMRGVDGETFAGALIRFEAQHHTNLVWMEANRMAARMSNRTADDLIGWGWLGLRQAVRQFDPSLGYQFSTYACFRIKGAIRDGVRDENPIPKRLLTLQRKVAVAVDDLRSALGRQPSIDEIAEHIGENAEPLRTLLPRLAAPASVEEMQEASDAVGAAISPALHSDDDPAQAAEASRRNEAIWDAIGQLDPKDAQAVTEIVVLGNSVAETRRRTGVSDRELRRRVERGCEALRVTLADWQA